MQHFKEKSLLNSKCSGRSPMEDSCNAQIACDIEDIEDIGWLTCAQIARRLNTSTSRIEDIVRDLDIKSGEADVCTDCIMSCEDGDGFDVRQLYSPFALGMIEGYLGKKENLV